MSELEVDSTNILKNNELILFPVLVSMVFISPLVAIRVDIL